VSFQNITLVGRLGKDVEVRATNGGKSVASFSLGVDDGYGESKTVEWFNIVAWEKLADIAGKYLKKGSFIGIIGSQRTRTWDKDGVKQYRAEIIVRDLKLLDKSSSGEKSRQSAPASRPAAAPVARPTTTNEDPFADENGF
jgi:single-strand DNA-binding protein